ncbi:MAG: hypothetical protein WCH62_06175 [Candidatus Omnitrophota bacterium]
MNNEIKDIKPPIDLPNPLFWFWIALAVIFILAVLTWLFLWWKKRSHKQKKIDVPVIPAWVSAYQRLESLCKEKLIEAGDFKSFYIELSDIARHYLEERFLLRAPEMTTEEFLEKLKTSPALNSDQQNTLKEFLFICDMVKFAKHQPTAYDAQKSFDLVKQLIDQTHGI